MKAKFTLLVVLFLLTTGIYALDPSHYKRDKLTSSFLQTRLERTEGHTKHNPFQRKMGFQKQANSLKSAQAIKQRLDSYTYQELEDDGKYEKGKFEFIYDVNGMLTHEREYNWEEIAAKMLLVSVSETTYDAAKKIIQYSSTYLNETTNQFITEYKVTYSYDKNGNMTQSINNYWDSTNNHAEEFKTDYIYDSDGNLIQENSSSRNETVSQFVFRYKTDYTYDGSGKQTQQINYIWDNYFSKQWEPSSKYEFTYDSKGNLIVSLKSSANNLNNTWTWAPDYKEEYTYDPNGFLTQIFEYNPDSNNQWKLDDKQVNVYDDNGNKTQWFYYFDWDVQTNQWDDIYKEEYTYDNKYTKNDLILPFDNEDGLNFTHMITKIKEYSWDSSMNRWAADGEIAFAYSPINITGIENISDNEVKAYPNPAIEFVMFELKDASQLASIELTDIQGKKVFSQILPDNKRIVVSQLKSGMYFYTVNQNKRLYKGKVVKE